MSLGCERSRQGWQVGLSRRLGTQDVHGPVLLGLILAGCGPAAPAATPTDLPDFQTAVAATVESLATDLVETVVALSATPTPTATATPTPTLTPSLTPTATPTVIAASVSVATNCRSAPTGTSSVLGAVEVGEMVMVVGRTTYPNYWYVTNPDRPGEFCWLWGEYATVVGETDPLPVLTPAVTPRPLVSASAGFEGFQTCGGLHAIFWVQNTGRTALMTAQRYIRDLDTNGTIFGAELDRHPFAPWAPACPPGHDNNLDPGGRAYIYVPVDDVPYGHLARATLRMCTQDYLAGECVTAAVDFRFPDE